MNNTNFNWNNDVLNIMAALGYAVSMINLDLNLKQTSTDELNKHLDKQDKILREQNDDYLKKIIEQNQKIINLLEGSDYHGKNGKL